MALKILYSCPDYRFYSTFKTSPSSSFRGIHPARVLFLTHFHLNVMGECCIPWREKKNQEIPSNALLHTLLAFGSLQQIHKAHHTINIDLQTFLATIFISLPIDQEWVLSFLAEFILPTHNKNRSKTIHMFFDIVTDDKT